MTGKKLLSAVKGKWEERAGEDAEERMACSPALGRGDASMGGRVRMPRQEWELLKADMAQMKREIEMLRGELQSAGKGRQEKSMLRGIGKQAGNATQSDPAGRKGEVNARPA